METTKFKITGLSPLMMHSNRMVNPLDPLTKEMKKLTGVRKKTDETHEAIARLEWMAGLYWDSEAGVYVPGDCLQATLFNGAKLQKLGTAFKRSCMVLELKCPLIFDGPDTPDKLFEDAAFVDVRAVRVQTATVMRCRPVFNNWVVEFSVGFNAEQMNREDIVKIAEDAGQLIGLCENRPRYGKFAVEVV